MLTSANIIQDLKEKSSTVVSKAAYSGKERVMNLKKICFCTAGVSEALTHARNRLLSWGYSVVSKPDETVTHLLLPVPSLDADGAIKGGSQISEILPQLPPDVTVLGGMLPQLSVHSIDLLQDPHYTAENAAITAHCALGILMRESKSTLANAPVLILGWGRIGKCLAQLLTGIGAHVTIAARKPEDRAMAEALRLDAVPLPVPKPEKYTLIINTIPAPVLDAAQCQPGSLLLDLASKKGIEGDGVHWERGLPGKLAPQTAGTLMAKTALRYALGKE